MTSFTKDTALQFLDEGLTPPPGATAPRATGKLSPSAVEFNRERASAFLDEEVDRPPLIRGVNTPGTVLFRGTPEGQEVLGRLEEQGVDTNAGADFNTRAQLSLSAEERRDEMFEKFFPLGVRQTSVGPVARISNPDGSTKEILIDERGFSFGDFADASQETLEATGAILAAIPTGGTNLLLTALAAAIGGQIAGGGGELLTAMANGGLDFTDEKDQKFLMEILKRRGQGAVIDTMLDYATAGGARLIGRGAQGVAGPFANRMSQTPQVEIKEAADRLDIPLTPGEQTGSLTLQRVEAIQGKVPGSSGPIQRAEEAVDNRIRAINEDLARGVPSNEEVGRAVRGEISKQKEAGDLSVKAKLSRAQRAIEQRIEALTNTMATRSLSETEAGQLTRRVLQREKLKFRARQDELAKNTSRLIDELPEGADTFASTAGVKQTARELRDQFPKKTVVEEAGEATSRETIPELFPSQARRTIKGLLSLDDNVTVQELRNARNVISQSINDAAAFPGVSVGMLKKIEASLTRAIGEAADNAPTRAIGDAIRAELSHFREGIKPFQSQIVARAFRDEGTPGFMEAEKILPDLFRLDKTEDIKRILRVLPGGTQHVAFKAARRSAFEKMKRASAIGDAVGDDIDPGILNRKIRGMRPETQALLFGSEEKAKEIQGLLALLSARTGKVKVADLRGNDDITDTLREAARQELRNQQVFESRIFKPIIEGKFDATLIPPEELVRWTFQSGSRTELRQLMNRLPEPVREEYRRRVALNVLSKSASQSNDPEELIRVLNENAGIGENLIKIMTREFADNTQDSLGKLKEVLGDDGFKILKDLATVEAARARKAQVGAAAGGLLGGSLVSSIIRGGLTGIPTIIKYRIASALMASPAARKWLTSGVKLPKGGKKTAAFTAALPQITEAVAAVTDNADVVQKVIDLLRNDEGSE